MDREILVEITVSRIEDEVEYRVVCSKGVRNEELAHYLNEIIEGICVWNSEACEETVKTIVGKVRATKTSRIT